MHRRKRQPPLPVGRLTPLLVLCLLCGRAFAGVNEDVDDKWLAVEVRVTACGQDAGAVLKGVPVTFSATVKPGPGLKGTPVFQWSGFVTGSAPSYTRNAEKGDMTAVCTVTCDGSKATDSGSALGFDVVGFTCDRGVEDAEDGDPLRTTFLVPCAPGTAAVRVVTSPSVSESQLPSSSMIDGGVKVDRLRSDHSTSEPGQYDLRYMCCGVAATQDARLSVIQVKFEKAGTEDAAGNNYGYDTMDTPASSDDDHVSVRKNDSTYVTVKVAGGLDGSVLHFTSSDGSTVEPGAVPSPAPGTGFLLKVRGKDQDASEAQLQARLGGATGPVCSDINMNVYKEKTVNEWDIYRITDSHSGGTSPLSAIDEATTLASANAIVKKGVMRFASVNLEDRDIHYDVNSNGALDWYYDGGAQTEFSLIQSAGLAGNPKIAVVKSVNFAWRLSANAAAGQPKANVVGTSYLSSWIGRTYTLGTGANAENVTLLTLSGSELTFSENLVNAHISGEPLLAAFGAGVGADPQLVEDGTAIQTTLLHETLHRTDIGSLFDLDSPLNIMHYQAAVGHTEFRFKEAPRYYESGNESQWQTIPRP